MNAVAIPIQSKGRVLCIDDEPHVLRALQWLLQKEFEVHTCDCATEALRLLRRHDFDVVVSDQRMPGITGVEFLRHVRKLAPRAMRILLTGYSDLDAMVKSVNESEVYRFITKPWDVRALPKLIAEAAEVARAEPPVRDADPPEATTANEVTTVAMRQEALLVIDDHPDLHAQVAQALDGKVEVLHAYDLASALTMLDSRSCAVIVSEVKVGGLDATRLVKMLKGTRPEIVTLVVSGQKDAETVMSLINQGQVYRIVPKPVKSGFVRLLVDSALKRHHQLLEAPSARRRFAVEPAGRAAVDSLYKDIMAVGMGVAPASFAAAAPMPGRVSAPRALSPGHSRSAQADPPRDDAASGSSGMLDGLKAGFRRLFGG